MPDHHFDGSLFHPCREPLRIGFVRLPVEQLLVAHGRGFGGAEVRAWTFARHLAHATEASVSMVVGRSERKFVPDTLDGVRIMRVSNARSLPRGAEWLQRWTSRRHHEVRLAKLVQQAGWHIVATFGVHAPTPVVVRAAKSTRTKSVVFLTSDEDTWRLLSPGFPRNRRDQRQQRALLAADLLVAQTEWQWQLAERVGRPVVWIRNPVELGEPTSQTVRERGRYFLWIGRADTQSKRADWLYRVARRCPEIPFVALFNDAPDVSRAERLGPAPRNVQCRDAVPWHDVDPYFAQASGLLNTSDSEGFPNAFLQAAKHGVPIVSRRVNPDRVLTRHGLGFVAGDDEDHLVAMVRQVWQTPEAFAQVADNARRYVWANHRAQDRAHELYEVLYQLSQREISRWPSDIAP